MPGDKSSSGRVVNYPCRGCDREDDGYQRGLARDQQSRGHMHNLTIRRRRRGRHRVLPCDLPASQITSTRLDRSSVVLLCAVCIEAGRATEATFQTSDQLCGCDQHILELERDGRAAIHRQRNRVAAQAVESR